MSNPPRAHNRLPRVGTSPAARPPGVRTQSGRTPGARPSAGRAGLYRGGVNRPDAMTGPSLAESFMTARINIGKVFRADSPNFFLLLGIDRKSVV